MGSQSQMQTTWRQGGNKDHRTPGVFNTGKVSRCIEDMKIITSVTATN